MQWIKILRFQDSLFIQDFKLDICLFIFLQINHLLFQVVLFELEIFVIKKWLRINEKITRIIIYKF